MKPAPFAYARPTELGEVLALLDVHRDGARILAGGQSLMATLNMRLSAPDLLIDINRVDGLAGISVDGSTLRVGAMTRLVELEESSLVTEHVPLVAMALPSIAHPAIRNRATFGGSIAFADPAAELPACAVALGATMVVAGPEGERRVAAEDFFEGLYRTALGECEVLVAVELPVRADGDRSGFQEVARRHGDYAIVGLAVHGKVAGGAFAGMRLVYFGAGDRPVLARGAGRALEGRAAGEPVADATAALDEDLDPPEDLHADGTMRRHLARVLAERTLAAMGDA